MEIILQLTRSIAVLPILAMGLTSPFVSVDMFKPSLAGFSMVQTAPESGETQKEANLLTERSGKIDAYFKKRSMPLEGTGKKMVLEAMEHRIDWRLLPAIAVRESSGGIQACGYNPFGWGSCRLSFKSWNESIEVLARNLGGDNPNTASYYSGSTELKLYHYNGTVLPTYPQEVLDIMDTIGNK